MASKSASQAQPARRRILIIDSQPLMRRGLRALIDSEPDLSVCAAAGTHRSGLEAVASFRPDLVITDLWLADSDGLALVRDIRSNHQDLPILVLTLHDAPRYKQLALQSGASGYVTKQELGETLLIAIRSVLGGDTFVSPKIGDGRDGN